MSRIIIENTSFTTEELKKQSAAPARRGGAEPWSGFSENAVAALRFCQDWLSGKEAFQINTSGSVGKPKAISLSRKQIKTSIKMSDAALAIDRSLMVLVCLPVRYIGGLMMLARAMELGMDAEVVEPSGNPLENIREDHQFAFVSMVPLQLQKVLETKIGRSKLGRFKIVLIGGAPLNKDLENAILSCDPPGNNAPAIYHTYGMTETASHIALRRLNGLSASQYFKPLQGIEIALDERGCLMVKGEVTNGVFLQTNDLAEIGEEGFRITGRMDNTINTGGVKVQPEKVERAISAVLKSDMTFFVASVPDRILGEKLIAVFETATLHENFAQELKAMLQDSLNRFEIPATFFSIREFVYTLSGKINRSATMERLKTPESKGSDPF